MLCAAAVPNDCGWAAIVADVTIEQKTGTIPAREINLRIVVGPELLDIRVASMPERPRTHLRGSARVEQSGGHWRMINDLQRLEVLLYHAVAYRHPPLV